MEEKPSDDYAPVPRHKDESVKMNLAGYREDTEAFVLTLADMDFAFSNVVRKEITRRIQSAHFGYNRATDEWRECVAKHIKQHYNCGVDPKRIQDANGIDQLLQTCIEIYSKIGDAVLFLTPCYFLPFVSAGYRKAYESELKVIEGRFYIDFEDVEKKLSLPQVKILLLIHPHNPCGRIWNKQDMKKISDLVLRTGKVLISDEVYADQVYGEFHSFLEYADELKQQLVVCNSPSKTFNASGTLTGYGVFYDGKEASNYSYMKVMRFAAFTSKFSQITLMSCYTAGEEWRKATNLYIQENYRLLVRELKKRLPKLTVFELEAGYLPLVDFKNYNIPGADIDSRLAKYNIFLGHMKIFYVEQKADTTLFRITIAMNREVLGRFISKLEEAMQSFSAESREAN